MTAPLPSLDLFSGIGGLALGLEQAGATMPAKPRNKTPVSRQNNWGPSSPRSPRVFARRMRTAIAMTLMRWSTRLALLALVIAPWIRKGGEE